MIDVQKAFSQYAILYFIPLVFIGAFILLNLTLAVVKSAYTCVLEQFHAKINE